MAPRPDASLSTPDPNPLTRLRAELLAEVNKIYVNAGLSEEEAGRISENLHEITTCIEDYIAEHRISKRFLREKVESRSVYPPEYRPKSIEKQVDILRALIPVMGFADAKRAKAPLPEGAEGYFAIPRWQTIAPTYREAVEKVFSLIARQRKQLINYTEGELVENDVRDEIRETEKLAESLAALGEEQKDHDILVIPAQFGMGHRGCSPRRARAEMPSYEFGLGTFAVGIMLLTHPERLSNGGTLWLGCVGDHYKPIQLAEGEDKRFLHVPAFGYGGGGLRFGFAWLQAPVGKFGFPSGFLEKRLIRDPSHTLGPVTI